MEDGVRTELLKRLKLVIPKKQIFEFAPMSKYTTLRLGGPAEVLCEVASAEEIAQALAAVPYLEILCPKRPGLQFLSGRLTFPFPDKEKVLS